VTPLACSHRFIRRLAAVAGLRVDREQVGLGVSSALGERDNVIDLIGTGSVADVADTRFARHSFLFAALHPLGSEF
jgi:hypothetical protein